MNYTQCGSALALPYADGIAQTCITSPPYYGLRDYGTAGQIGLEQTPAAYVAQIVAAMREVWRVLRDDGTLWLNLGDSYASGKGSCFNPGGGASSLGKERKEAGAHPLNRGNKSDLTAQGLKPKDLIGIPWRVAFALQDDGWYLRSDIIWAKPNPMPESVTDRPTKSHEYLFLLAKQPRYYYDAEAVLEPLSDSTLERWSGGGKRFAGHDDYFIKRDGGKKHIGQLGETGLPPKGARNARSVWQIATQPYSGAHFATMPPELARRCILAGSSARGQCPKCGAPWVRVVETERTFESGSGKSGNPISAASKNGATMQGGGVTSDIRNGPTVRNTTTGWEPSCDCNAGDPVPQIVLDPFAGSGTTAMVALQNGRQAIGTELNPKYLRLQDDRTRVTMGLGL